MLSSVDTTQAMTPSLGCNALERHHSWRNLTEGYVSYLDMTIGKKKPHI